MLLMLAGLQTIPPEQYEAAAIDGASAWQRFRYVTLPNLRYLLIVASTLDVINTIRHYDIIGVMTAGGPANATEVLPVLLYNTAFRGNRFGEAAAIGVALLRDRACVFAALYVCDHAAGPRGRCAVKRRFTGVDAMRWIVALAALAVTVFPFYWMLNTSLKPASEVFAVAADVRVGALVARRLPLAVHARARRRYFLNSLIVARGRDRAVGVPRRARRVRLHALLRARRDGVHRCSCCSPRCCRRRC